MKRVPAFIFLLAMVVIVTGCSCASDDYSLLGGTDTSAADLGNASGVALKAAQEKVKSVAPDAVPVMIGSSGVAIAPPPEQWSVMFVSPSKGRLYSVDVSHKQAEAAREMGSSEKLRKADIDVAVDYSTLKVGSDEAYEKAKAELSKTGDVPPNVMESITLVKMPVASRVAVWQVSFLKGTSTDGMRTAEVDAMTGEVTETTK